MSSKSSNTPKCAVPRTVSVSPKSERILSSPTPVLRTPRADTLMRERQESADGSKRYVGVKPKLKVATVHSALQADSCHISLKSRRIRPKSNKLIERIPRGYRC